MSNKQSRSNYSFCRERNESLSRGRKIVRIKRTREIKDPMGNAKDMEFPTPEIKDLSWLGELGKSESSSNERVGSAG